MSDQDDVNLNGCPSTTRYALGSIFILVNFILFCISSNQLFRSRQLFPQLNENKSLQTRILNLITSMLLLIFSLIDTDFWIWSDNIISEETQTPNDSTDYYILVPSSGIFTLNIIIKGFLDILFGITGSLIVYSIIKTYFTTQLAGQDFPKHIRRFWLFIPISFSICDILCILLALIIPAYILVNIYSNLRLLYLSIATLYLAYTYYWVFYQETQLKKHLRNAILLLIFAILSFIASIYYLVETGLDSDLWNIQNVVFAGINYPSLSTAESATSFTKLFIGWGGYWFVILWYMKFVWITADTSAANTRKHTGTGMEIGKLSSTHVFSTDAAK